MALYDFPPTGGNWKKFDGDPILGDEKIGTCFDIFLLEEPDELRMYFSWRPKKSLAVTTSKDGINWSPLKIILEPRQDTAWEDDLNRNCIVKVGGKYHMWYTGQARGYSFIGYATSQDGYNFERQNNAMPVLKPESYWENRSVMNPHVLWDEKEQIFKMWYSGGETYEPNAIGYATSHDGISWEKHPANPILVHEPKNQYEQERIGGCQVKQVEDGYLIFYIGYEDIDTARICVAKSPDGITRWQRSAHNPIVSPAEGEWDAHACYKPFVLYDRGLDRWRLYYNGRREGVEYVGMAEMFGCDFGF